MCIYTDSRKGSTALLFGEFAYLHTGCFPAFTIALPDELRPTGRFFSKEMTKMIQIWSL